MDTPCWKAKAKPEKEQRCRKYRALRPLCRANTIQPETAQGSLVHNAFHSFVLFYNSFVHTFHSIARFFDTLCTLFECSKSHCADHIALDRLNIQPSTANTQPHCFKSDLNEQAEKPSTKTKQNSPKKKFNNTLQLSLKVTNLLFTGLFWNRCTHTRSVESTRVKLWFLTSFILL